jgi:hypothetical protein
MRIKGGGLWFIRDKFEEGGIPHRLLDGKIISTLGFGALCLAMGLLPWWQCAIAALGWLGGVAPSIGEDIQAAREGNWKPGFQRGAFLGSALALGMWNPFMILSGLAFPWCYLLGEKINKHDWKYGEYIYGGVIGFFIFLWYNFPAEAVLKWVS